MPGWWEEPDRIFRPTPEGRRAPEGRPFPGSSGLRGLRTPAILPLRPRGLLAGGALVLAALVGCAQPQVAPPAPEPLPPDAPTPGIRFYTGEGEPSSWEALVEAAGQSRVILLGEVHDDVAGHRTRHALLRILAGGAALEPGIGGGGGPPPADGRGDRSCEPHVVSLEMLETDVQLVVDEYLAGLITRDHFLQSARPWNNHERDYEPYLEVARRCSFPVVAANPPRRYVNRVARLGSGSLEDLSPEARATLPPLPVAPPSTRYRAEWDALMGRIPAHGDAEGHPPGGEDPPHGEVPAHPEGPPHPPPSPHTGNDPGSREPPPDPILEAQNLWDAGMAWAVAEAARSHPGARVVHVAGVFHVQNGTGIPEHLERYLPEARPLLVVAYPVAPGTPFDPAVHGGTGDFVLLTPR